MAKTIRSFSFESIGGDIFGGLTAATVTLPFALAFGLLSGLGPITGLYCAVILGIVAAVLGRTPGLISGPTAPVAILMAIVVQRFSDDLSTAMIVVATAGLLQILLGSLRLGRYVNLVPFVVVSGFTTGIGCLIIFLQIAPFLGQSHPGAGILTVLGAVPGDLKSANLKAAAVGALTLGIIYGTPNALRRFIPAELIALIVGTAVVWKLQLDIPLLGAIPSGFPQFSLPTASWSAASDILGTALVLAMIGSISTLLTALVAEGMTHTPHDADRELVGQGFGNVACSLFGALPGGASPIRTVANIRTGGRTPFAGIVCSLSIGAVIFWLGPVAAEIPLAVLAGILAKVGIDSMDWAYLKKVPRAPRAGVIIMLVVVVLTVFVDVIVAVGVGLVAASLLFVKRMTDIELANLKSTSDDLSYGDQEQEILQDCEGGLIVYQISGPMNFGAARGLTRQIAVRGDYQILALDLGEVSYIDTSSSMAIEDIILTACKSDIRVLIIGLQPRVRKILDAMKALDPVNKAQIFDNRIDAFTFARDYLKDKRVDQAS